MTLVVAIGSLAIAVKARQDARRSADAAVRSADIAELVERRRRFGWTLEPRDGRNGLTLRNLGTLEARNVVLTGGESRVHLSSAGKENGDLSIGPGQGVAFLVATQWGSSTAEITITWAVEGEVERRTWVEPIPE